MAELTYEPANELAPLKVGDAVEVLDRQGISISTQTITAVARLFVTTGCSRRWTRSRGEWVSEIRNRKPISWPFPSIRKAA